MKQFLSENIYNIALLGHANSGKSTVAEAMIFNSGVTERMGKAADKNLISNFDAQEKKRGISLSTSVYPVEHNDKKINLLDAPGLFDFAAGVSEAATAADSIVLVLSGKSGLTVGAEKCFELAKEHHKPLVLFVSKLDSVHQQFYGIMSTLAGHYGGALCPVIVPICDGEHHVIGYINLIENKQFNYENGVCKAVDLPLDDNIELMRTMMVEAIAAVDDALMEKYFSGEALTEQELLQGLKKGCISGELYPVYCGVGQENIGVKELTEALVQILPSAAECSFSAEESGNAKTVPVSATGPVVATVFKTIADPFVGKLSYVKVLGGTLKSDTKLTNQRTKKEEKIGKIGYIKAGEQEETEKIVAGDIGCMIKPGDVLTGDTLTDAGQNLVVQAVPFEKPTLSMAVYACKKGEEEKIATGLSRLAEEDPTIRFYVDPETKESVLSGLGEQHLDVIVQKLKAKFGVDVDLKSPKIAYRETIRKSVKAQGRHKKQSGGHGQFGDVWIEFMPSDEENLVFEENVFGGSVPKSFFPAVEKGLQESMKKGVLAGFPMVGVKAVLYDGSYHPVDSSEMAFKMAASLAFKEGIPKAGPVILEPVGALNVIAPDDNLGDVIGDINKRRGRVIGMNPLAAHRQEVVAEVPMAEMADFSTAMRSLTQGRATFTLTFARYEDAPQMIAEKIIAQNKTEE